MPPALTIRVLGAGVSGLAAAGLLAADGHHVDLIDERFDVPAVGTALGLFRSAQRVLERLGVLDAVRAAAAAPQKGTLRTADGRVLATVPAGDVLLIARSDLVRILQDALPRSVITHRRRIEDVRPLRAGADLLVGADGVHSLTRRSGWPGRPRARDHGATVLRGTAEVPPPEISETWGRGWLFGITPLAGERTNWFAGIPVHRTVSRAEDLAHLRHVVGGHRDEIDTVLAAATPERTLVHGIHTVPPLIPVREDVVLLGDAAHAMAPNLGHGANTALQDADALAAALREAPCSVGRALTLFAQRRTLPGQGWRVASGMVAAIAMTSDHAALRDRTLGGVRWPGRAGRAGDLGMLDRSA
ncbi:FAD-dependent monooxygenase [Brachybacterium sp. AOP43-C2-M15]|uniref:FAD-dependent monooxygenase n=1 Tax=Brachybacterium sp. AOP43-C2-M15 TaxID=3457661 RepID=UPI0040336073